MDALMNMVNSLLRLLGFVVVLAIALKIFLLRWNSPKQKGKRGEEAVARRLWKGLPDEFRILNDVYLPRLQSAALFFGIIST